MYCVVITDVLCSARKSYIKRLDPIHNQGLRLCSGAFRTSPIYSLHVETNEPSLHLRRTKLSLQYTVKLMVNERNPAYSVVLDPPYRDLYDAKENFIKPLGLRKILKNIWIALDFNLIT